MREKRSRENNNKRLEETYKNASWVMLATEEGIGPDKLLLFSRLIAIQIHIIRFFIGNSLHWLIKLINEFKYASTYK